MSLFQPYETHYCKLSESYQSGTATRDYIDILEFIKEPTDTAPRLVRANLPWGYLDTNGRAYAYITDYQGNIRAVVDADGTAIQTTDYYPYGLPMATTTGTAANRYKYGAKEFETRNGLNFHDFEARMLFNDRTLFSRPDDLAGKYPHLNPYLYCAANPLRYIDPTGEELHYMEGDNEYVYQIENNKIAVYDLDGNMVDQSTLSQIHQDTLMALNELIQSKTGFSEVSKVISSDKIVKMSYKESKRNSFIPAKGELYFDPYKNKGGMSYDFTSGRYSRDVTAAINLSHEMGHAEDWVNETFDESTWVNYNGKVVAKCEMFACMRENQYRKEIGYPLRISYLTVRSKEYGDYYPAQQTFLLLNPLFIPHKRIIRQK